MHWLTWQEIGKLFTSWQGIAATIITALGAIYYGPRKLLETWDWYLDRYLDAPVLDIVRNRRLSYPPHVLNNFSPPPQPREGFYTVVELAQMLKRSRPSIGKSVQRLIRRGKIEQYQGGVKIKG